VTGATTAEPPGDLKTGEAAGRRTELRMIERAGRREVEKVQKSHQGFVVDGHHPPVLAL
jgi:hypothetical protein